MVNTKKANIVQLSNRERNAILAGLRALQCSHTQKITNRSTVIVSKFDGIEDILTNGKIHNAITFGEVDMLCEKINISSE